MEIVEIKPKNPDDVIETKVILTNLSPQVQERLESHEDNPRYQDLRRAVMIAQVAYAPYDQEVRDLFLLSTINRYFREE